MIISSHYSPHPLPNVLAQTDPGLFSYLAISSSLMALNITDMPVTCKCVSPAWISFLTSRLIYTLELNIFPWLYQFSLVQFSSVTQSCLSLCDPINCSTPGLPVHHQLPEFTQTHVHWVSDAIQPSHPLSSPSPPSPNPSQHQSLFQWVNSSHVVAKVIEFQLEHHSFQRTPRTNLL